MLNNYFNITSILIGAIFLSIGSLYTFKIIKVNPPLKKAWVVLFSFILAFILGYIAFCGVILINLQISYTYIASLILFGGGIFVFIISKLSLKTIDLVKKAATFKYDSEHDALTNSYNSRFFHKHMKLLLHQTQRGGPELILVFIDLDNFKSVNDTYGHLEGDKLLVKTVKIFEQNLRGSDFVARLGGDEFVIVLYNTKIEFVEGIMERIQFKLMDYVTKHYKKCKNVGCSFGVNVLDKNSKDIDSILKKADENCYVNKKKRKEQQSGGQQNR